MHQQPFAYNHCTTMTASQTADIDICKGHSCDVSKCKCMKSDTLQLMTCCLSRIGTTCVNETGRRLPAPTLIIPGGDMGGNLIVLMHWTLVSS